MHVISRWSVRYVSCLPFSQSWFCMLACKNRFLHNLNNLHIFLHWCFFWYWIVELWHNTNMIGQYQWHRAVTGTTPTLWFQILHIVTFRHSTILTCGARIKRFRGLQVVRSMTWMCLMEFTVLTFECKIPNVNITVLREGKEKRSFKALGCRLFTWDMCTKYLWSNWPYSPDVTLRVGKLQGLGDVWYCTESDNRGKWPPGECGLWH